MKNLVGLSAARVVEQDALASVRETPLRATLRLARTDGLLDVETDRGQIWTCEVLLTGNGMTLAPGDQVLVLPPDAATGMGVVLGRVGRYEAPALQASITIEATETLSLKCGEASIDLRADGKVMVRGEDVLLRAKGTQRIRAGTVSIN